MTTSESPVRTKPWTFGDALSLDEIGDLEREYVLKVLDERRLFRFSAPGSSRSETLQVEALYSERLGVEHCLAVNGGTAALTSALIGAGIGPGDEVIVPGYTYIATASAVLVARAVPVIVEVDDSLTMDPQAFEAAITPYTKAVIPVHMRGVPCDMDAIMAVARRHNLVVIEDVAQANGGSYKGWPLGSFGNAGCFSFQQYKLVTAGEGGLVATNSDALYRRAVTYHDCAFYYWRTTDSTVELDSGREDQRYPDVFPGENYRMSELNAALVLAQSQRIDSLVTRLRKVKRSIVDRISDLEQIQLQRIPDPDGDVAYSLIFYLADSSAAEDFSARLTAEGIRNGTVGNNGFADRHIYKNWHYVLNKQGASEKDTPWNCASYQGNVEYSPDMCPRTLDWLGRAVGIFLHQNMTEEDCNDIATAIRKVARAARP